MNIFVQIAFLEICAFRNRGSCGQVTDASEPRRDLGDSEAPKIRWYEVAFTWLLKPNLSQGIQARGLPCLQQVQQVQRLAKLFRGCKCFARNYICWFSARMLVGALPEILDPYQMNNCSTEAHKSSWPTDKREFTFLQSRKFAQNANDRTCCARKYRVHLHWPLDFHGVCSGRPKPVLSSMKTKSTCQNFVVSPWCIEWPVSLENNACERYSFHGGRLFKASGVLEWIVAALIFNLKRARNQFSVSYAWRVSS